MFLYALAATNFFCSFARVPPENKVEGPAPKLPLWWVIAVNTWVIINTAPFFWLPRGAGIRPMGWGMSLVLSAGLGFVGIIIGMRKKYERMPFQWLVIIMGFSPFPLGILLLQLARLLRGLIMER